MTDRYLNAQVSILGSVLLDNSCLGNVMFRMREEDFIGPYRTVFKAIQRIHRAGKPVDIAIALMELGQEYDLLLHQIQELTPTAANVDSYIDIALEEAQIERLRAAGEALKDCADLETGREILSKAERALASRPGMRIVSMTQGIQDFYTRQKTEPQFLRFGMEKLDGLLMLERGDFLVIGGHPSAGKTALSLQLAWAQAERFKVGYFSLETKPEKLVDRAMAMVTGVDFGKIKRRQLNQEDWKKCAAYAVAMSKRNVDMIQSGGLTVADIQSLSLSGGYDVIYIDYLQLVRPEDKRRPDYEQVSQISRDLHTMAQTTGITVVALSQLARPTKTWVKEREGEEKKEVELAPTLHSLRQSGQIEQDADAVLLLYLENSKKPAGRRSLKLAKNKDGEVGGILSLDFNGRIQRFTQAEKPQDPPEEDPDAPW